MIKFYYSARGDMGYFDGLTDAAFKKGADGNALFYPWGILGKGYILASHTTHERIRNFMKRYYKATIPALIAVPIAYPLYGIYGSLIFIGALLIPYAVWYIVSIKRMTSGLEITDEKLTISESSMNSAKSHSLATLIYFIAICLLVVAAGFWLISEGKVLIGSLGVAFFGLGIVVFVYMIKVKLSQR